MGGLFAKVSPSAARLGTLFARHARKIPFRAGEAGWLFSHGARGSAVHGVVAYGSLGTAECSLWLDEPGWRTAAATVLEIASEDVSALPPALIRAALECFFSDALAAAEKAIGLPLALTGIEVRETPALASAFPFRLEREDGLVLTGAWTASEGEWREALEAALSRNEPSLADLPDSLRLAGSVSAGNWRMPAGALEGLERGDLVLSPRGASWSLTVGRRFRFAAAYEKGKLVADGKRVADAGVETAFPEDAAVALAGLDAAEVELRAEVGRLNVTLGELRRLSVGEVVEFATGLASPATLMAGGRAVATGELVEVGGRVGVRITAMAQVREENA